MAIRNERQRAEDEEQEPRPPRRPPRVGIILRRRRRVEHSHDNKHRHHPCHPQAFRHPYPPDGRQSKIHAVVIYIIIIPGVGKVRGIIRCCVRIPPNTTPTTAIPIKTLLHRIILVGIIILGITMVGTGIVKIIPDNGNHDPLG